MGGGDNELIIKTLLDATGFKKGSKELTRAVNGLTNTFKGLFGRIAGVASVVGIISKAVSTYMSQNEQLTKQMNAAWTALGNALGPIINEIVGWITKAISYLIEFMRLLGLTSKNASQASKAAKSAAGTLNRTLAGFDEINKLSAGGKGDGQLENKEAPDWIKDIADFLKKGEWEKAGNALADKLNDVIAGVDWQGIGEKIGYYLNAALTFAAAFLKQFDWQNLGGSLAKGINGIMNSVDWKNLGTIMTAKFRILLLSIVGFINEFDWAGFGKALGDYFIGVFNSLSDTLKKVDWGKLGLKLWDALVGFLAGVDWDGLVSSFFEFLGTAFGAASMFIESLCYGIIEDLVDWLTKTIEIFQSEIEAAGGDVGQGILNGIKKIWENIKEWIVENILNPFINGFKSTFEIHSPSKVTEELGGLLGDGLLAGLKKVLGRIGEWVSDVKDRVGKVKDGVAEKWNGLKSKTEEVWNRITGSVSESFNSVKDEAEESSSTLKNKMTEAYSKVKDTVTEKMNAIKEKTVSGFEKVKSAVNDKMNIIRDKINSGFSQGANMASQKMVSLKSSVINVLSSMGSSAYLWGRDLLVNFWNGISSFTSYLYSGIYGIAQGIRNMIGFSEPKEGPLSDFHTYGPDMMELYAEGINSAKDKVFNAVNSVAEGVADGMSGANLPASSVASGLVTPYSVGGEGAVGYGGDLATQISNAVYDAVTAAMERMQSTTGQHVAVLEVNGREFCRATYYDQQAVAREHGVTLITNG